MAIDPRLLANQVRVLRAGSYRQAMDGWLAEVEKLADSGDFSGVVRVDRAGRTTFAVAAGMADRRHGVPNELDTRFALASATKGLTALAVMSLVEDGGLELTTTARSLLGDDLPLIDDAVTVEQLLAHRSGIGDYFDEDVHEDVNDYVLPVSVHRLAETSDYLAVLGGFEQDFEPDARFAYCNGGYVVLALLAERASGHSFQQLVAERVCAPAAMADTAFLRSDELPGGAAVGYLSSDGPRTNIFHLPVRGSGDGGIYSTAADLSALWRALFDGKIVSPASVAEMVRRRSVIPAESEAYGLGFWLHESSRAVSLTGSDAGVSCWSGHDPDTATTYTVIANSSESAWPIARVLYAQLPT